MTKDANKSAVTFTFAVDEGTQSKDGFWKLPLKGHLDAEAAHGLTGLLRKLLENGRTRVELDCTAVRFISSTGIGCIVAAVGDYRDAGGDIVVSGLSETVRAVLVSLDLVDYIPVR